MIEICIKLFIKDLKSDSANLALTIIIVFLNFIFFIFIIHVFISHTVINSIFPMFFIKYRYHVPDTSFIYLSNHINLLYYSFF